jgi:hypothetical protein
VSGFESDMGIYLAFLLGTYAECCYGKRSQATDIPDVERHVRVHSGVKALQYVHHGSTYLAKGRDGRQERLEVSVSAVNTSLG